MTIKIEISNDKGETVANTPNRLNCRDKKVTRCVLDTNGYKKEYNKTLAAVYTVSSVCCCCCLVIACEATINSFG